MTPKISTIMETSIFSTTLVIQITPNSWIFPCCPPFFDFFSKENLAILVRFFDFSLLPKRFFEKNISKGDGQGKIRHGGMISMTNVVLKIEVSMMVERAWSEICHKGYPGCVLIFS